MIFNKNLYQKITVLTILFIIALLSVTVVSDYATSLEVHAVTLEELDEKKMTALGLTASVTAVSTAISAIPGDAATPIAEQISELTTPLLIIVCAIYLEKFLLTTLGYVSFEPCLKRSARPIRLTSSPSDWSAPSTGSAAVPSPLTPPACC